MTTRAEYKPLLNGEDVISSSIIAFFKEHGWEGDYIIKNIAAKQYDPHKATVRVHLDSDNNQYFVKGEYYSKGENVLSLCTAYIKGNHSSEEITAALRDFLKEVEKCINESFAVRFLGPKARNAEDENYPEIDHRPDDPHLPEFHKALHAGFKGTFYEWHKEHFGTFWCTGVAAA